MKRVRTKLTIALVTAALAVANPLAQQSPPPRTPAQSAIDTLLQNEQFATAHRGRYAYLSVEKSERTGGHTWTEILAETQWGRIRYLVAEDGKPLPPDRAAAEKAKLAAYVANPEGFRRQELAHGDDESHARAMLHLLPVAFLFDGPDQQGDTLRVEFRPNPTYQPQGMEEKVLHSMTGIVLIDAKTLRLRGLDCKVPNDVNFGLGLLATVKAGSYFNTMRVPVEGMDWKTDTVHTDFMAKALMLKNIARQQDSKHSEFRKIPNDIPMSDAVKLVEDWPAASSARLTSPQ
jgi:hypothetical protein